MAENKAAKPVEGQSEEIKDYEFRLLDADEIEVRVKVVIRSHRTGVPCCFTRTQDVI